jgi:Peptidase M15
MCKFRSLAGIAAAFALAISAIFIPTQSATAGTGCLPGVLKQRLSQIRQKFGPVRVISTFRRGARIAGSGRRSMHASCRAVDFKPPRGKYGQVVAWLKRNHGGGVGTYSCAMHHIHIDNGARVRYHHCVTASGRPIGKRARPRRRNSRVRIARRSRSGISRRNRIPRRAASQSRQRAATRKLASRPQKSFSALGYFSGKKVNGG